MLEPRPGHLPTGNLYGDDGLETPAVVRLQEVVEGEAKLADSSPRLWGRSDPPGTARAGDPVHPHARGADS